MQQKLRRQRAVKGGREWRGTGLLPTVEKAVQAEARRFGVTPSFVLSTMAAFVLHVDDERQEDYKTAERRNGRGRGK